MVPFKYIIYMVTNMVTSGRYIGLTGNSLQWRWTRHICDARIGKGNGLLLHAIRKYGSESFYVEELCRCKTLDDAKVTEISLIAEKATMKPHGYNLTAGGEGANGYRMPSESIERMRLKLTGRKRSQEAKDATAAKHRGMKRSEESRSKMRGRKLSVETREKIRIAAIEQWKRAPIPREVMERAWAASRKAGISEEGKRRISIANSHPKTETARMFMRMGRKIAKDRREQLRPPQDAGSLAALALMSMGC